MFDIERGSRVRRKSYNCDVLFKVVETITFGNDKKIALLHGVDYRLEADAPVEDLVIEGACPHGYIDWDDCPDCRH